jgi:hypothetical protein
MDWSKLNWIKIKPSGRLLRPVQKAEKTAVGIHHAGHATPSIRKSWH